MTDSDIYARIQHGRTADGIVLQLEALILEGVLRAGDRLPGERDLARHMDVSRPILREALKALEACGLLVSRRGGGTYVADVIGQVFTAPVADLISRHRKATLDYLEYRREIEGVTAELAARRVTAADRDLLTRTIEAMKTAHRHGDFEEEATHDVEFHSAVGECAHNIVLLHTLRACYRLLSEGVFYNRSLIYSIPGVREQLLAQHVAIYDAVMAGDASAARQAVEAHIDFVSTAIQDAERSSDWERVSRLRLQQRSRGAAQRNLTEGKAEA